MQLSSNLGHNNRTFVALRPTEGVFQVDGMGELDVDTYYGGFYRPGDNHAFSRTVAYFSVWVTSTTARSR